MSPQVETVVSILFTFAACVFLLLAIVWVMLPFMIQRGLKRQQEQMKILIETVQASRQEHNARLENICIQTERLANFFDGRNVKIGE
jgi:ABC-type bacteriocin/lantibiotic exporter with double-glycine peptidase domain